MFGRRLQATASAALFGLMALYGTGLGAEAYPSATEVQPILVGSPVPNASVVSLDGESMTLEKVIGKRPSVVIFYRGGW